MYNRVLPRDLFNEAKLLKCLGQLSLLIHDGRDAAGNPTPFMQTHFYGDDYEGFNIAQNPDSGDLYCENVVFSVRGTPLRLSTSYNSQEPYPLTCVINDDEISVLNDDGTLTSEFLEHVDTLHHAAHVKSKHKIPEHTGT